MVDGAARLIAGAIPYVHAPEWVIAERVPILGTPAVVQVFGPLVVLGVILGAAACVRFAGRRHLDPPLVRNLIAWVVVVGFVVSHVVEMVFYQPARLRAHPVELVMIWTGISSFGGFAGAAAAMAVYLRVKRQPILIYCDMLVYGLLLGWCFGRLGCSLVHDHPGKIATVARWLAVGPFPDGTFRYDLGLYEFVLTVGLTVTVYAFLERVPRKPGWLSGLVALIYCPPRFLGDFLRADAPARGVIDHPDARYLALTAGQWAALAFLGIGIWLLLRPPRPSDLAFARDPRVPM